MMLMMMTMMVMTMLLMMMMIMGHITKYIYILKVNQHGISKIRSPSAIPARSTVAPKMFKGKEMTICWNWNYPFLVGGFNPPERYLS